MGAQTGKGGDCITRCKSRNNLLNGALDRVKPLNGCVNVQLAVKVKINGRRTHKHVTVSGRSNKDTLAHF